jgi:hypothetical protein
MKISGFTFMRNAGKLGYPLAESIRSVLPIVDEFVIALGKGDDDDTTKQLLSQINSDKLKIVDTVWDTAGFPRRMEYAHQTDIAKGRCSGDWLLYLQSDEMVHEEDLPLIKSVCARYLDDSRVEGFLFRYFHFWGDYGHAFSRFYGWYQKEVRIVRNDTSIHSWRDAQSFRVIDPFDGRDYFTKKSRKLRVIELDAAVYHYGWVRPPLVMEQKTREFNAHASIIPVTGIPKPFDYGRMDRVPRFEGSHPAVMNNRIAAFSSEEALKHSTATPARPAMKHEKFRYRFNTFIINRLLFRHEFFGFRNYKKIGHFK